MRCSTGIFLRPHRASHRRAGVGGRPDHGAICRALQRALHGI